MGMVVIHTVTFSAYKKIKGLNFWNVSTARVIKIDNAAELVIVYSYLLKTCEASSLFAAESINYNNVKRLPPFVAS